jgi:hypothetical protein
MDGRSGEELAEGVLLCTGERRVRWISRNVQMVGLGAKLRPTSGQGRYFKSPVVRVA